MGNFQKKAVEERKNLFEIKNIIVEVFRIGECGKPQLNVQKKFSQLNKTNMAFSNIKVFIQKYFSIYCFAGMLCNSKVVMETVTLLLGVH